LVLQDSDEEKDIMAKFLEQELQKAIEGRNALRNENDSLRQEVDAIKLQFANDIQLEIVVRDSEIAELKAGLDDTNERMQRLKQGIADVLSSDKIVAAPPLQVDPSRKEAWSENFQKAKEFYEENGHLSFPKNDPEHARLCGWLTYQRQRSKTLRNDQLEQLESINYMAVPLHHDRDDDEWEVKYSRLKELYSKTALVASVDEATGGTDNDDAARSISRSPSVIDV
jgi:chromosome segregation ATPase